MRPSNARLKRGSERESCDFCHRRKVKCDRSARARQNLAGCSQCSLRDIQCSLDDSDDIRIRRRRLTSSTASLGHASIQDDTDGIAQNFPIQSVPLQQAVGYPSGPPTLEPVPSQDSLNEPSEFAFLDSTFDLNVDSVLFLDSIFMGNSSLFEESQPALPLTSGHFVDGDQMKDTEQNKEQPVSNATTKFHGKTTTQVQYWVRCDLDSDTFHAALEAYFQFSAICLPIIYEDAFWEDYHTGRCSHALVYAIACCGMPFTSAPDKWKVQQLLAHQFREAFFETQHGQLDQRGEVRLDDLEALALMLNFEYDASETSSLQSRLGELLLKHDSLVLMTLQSQTERHSTDSSEQTNITRERDRRLLLFWRVYGLDAFHTLDRKCISRIQDSDAESAHEMPLHSAGSYFDAILSLGIVARRITQVLFSPGTRQNGFIHHDVMSLYSQLQFWHEHVCPQHLQRRPGMADESSVPGVNSTQHTADTHLRLQRAVVWLLQINCYMQIESLIAEYGFREETSLQAEMAGMRVEYETLRVVNDAVEITSHLQRRVQISEREHSLIDLAPSMLRDICAGLCYWTCLRGMQVLSHGRGTRLVMKSKRNNSTQAQKRRQWCCELCRDGEGATRRSGDSNFTSGH